MSQHVNSISDTRPCKQTSINQARTWVRTRGTSGGTWIGIWNRFGSGSVESRGSVAGPWTSPVSHSTPLSITAAMAGPSSHAIPYARYAIFRTFHIPYSMLMLFMLIVSGHPPWLDGKILFPTRLTNYGGN